MMIFRKNLGAAADPNSITLNFPGQPSPSPASIALLDPATGGASSGTEAWTAANAPSEVPLTFFGTATAPTFFGGQPITVTQAPPNTPSSNFNYWASQHLPMLAVGGFLAVLLLAGGGRR